MIRQTNLMTQGECKQLSEWLTELENRHNQEIQLGLTRVKQVAEWLNLLHPPSIVITVGGTNGKGSTVALLEAMYVAAGYAVGSYTSPHLLNFNERIKINKEPILDHDLTSAFEIIEKSRGSVALTYFETVTLAALWHFQTRPLDVIILEVGLGGRLDATNIIDSDLAIITTVDKDHESYLGNTIEKIGYEKAGILRKNKPFIYADYAPPSSVLSHAATLSTPIFRNGCEYSYQINGDKFTFIFQNESFVFPKTAFHNNAEAAALMAVSCLKKQLPIHYTQCKQGLEQARLDGRLQWIKGPINTLIDVAHNPQSARYLANYLESIKITGQIHAIFSALEDKDLNEIISPLKQSVHYWYPALLDNKRASSAERITSSLEANDVKSELCYNNPVLAYQAACNKASPGDLIVVFGSFFMASAILSFINNPLYTMEIL